MRPGFSLPEKFAYSISLKSPPAATTSKSQSVLHFGHLIVDLDKFSTITVIYGIIREFSEL